MQTYAALYPYWYGLDFFDNPLEEYKRGFISNETSSFISFYDDSFCVKLFRLFGFFQTADLIHNGQVGSRGSWGTKRKNDDAYFLRNFKG